MACRELSFSQAAFVDMGTFDPVTVQVFVNEYFCAFYCCNATENINLLPSVRRAYVFGGQF